MESFYSSLKTERVGKKVYRARAQAKTDVFDYIECFYNPTRRHSTLGYLSPIDLRGSPKEPISVPANRQQATHRSPTLQPRRARVSTT